MKRFIVCFCAALLVFTGCSRKQNSTSEERLKWNTSTLVDAYERIGRKDARWDSGAREALEDFAKIRSGSDFEMETRLSIIGETAHRSVKDGCDDPLVRFLYCRYWVTNSSLPTPRKREEFRVMAQSLESSGYAPIRKFYGNVSAAELFWAERDTNAWQEVVQFRRAAMNDLAEALKEKTLPVEEVYFAAHELFQVLRKNSQELTDAYDQIQEPLFRNWPKAAASYLIKAEFYLEYAWRGRGNGTYDRLTDEQKKAFSERLQEATVALRKAWSLNPRDAQIPTLMIRVLEGQNLPRTEMETWFQRAMNLNTNNYQACRNKLRYLTPQWKGSADEMLAFGRECAASTNWAGRVPLILTYVHSEFVRSADSDLRRQYWSIPEIWRDMTNAYERFAAVNPKESRFRYPYAIYAFRGGHWETFREQIRLLHEAESELPFKYDYFGGKEELERMVEFSKHPQETTE